MRVNRHKLINATYVIIVLGMISSGIFLIYKNMSTPLSSLPCRNDEIGKNIKKQYGYLENDSSDLSQLAESVLAKPKYSKSANCLYILTKYSIKEGKIDDAQEYLNKMLDLQKKDPKNVNDFPGSMPNELLVKRMETIQDTVKTTRTNMMFTGGK